jgi:hypothetical protein
MVRALIFNIAGCVIWLVAIGTGLVFVSGFETFGGSQTQSSSDWPKDTTIALDRTRPTLLMFAHPHCPCTRASLEELKSVLGNAQGKVAAQIFFLSPAKTPGAWTLTDSWHDATRIPGLSVHYDTDGYLAGLFGADSSGEVRLYNPRGQLLFRGGITGGRGQTGSNTGEDALLTLIRGSTPSVSQTPVYGCSLGFICETSELGIAQAGQ